MHQVWYFLGDKPHAPGSCMFHGFPSTRKHKEEVSREHDKSSMQHFTLQSRECIKLFMAIQIGDNVKLII